MALGSELPVDGLADSGLNVQQAGEVPALRAVASGLDRKGAIGFRVGWACGITG